ncbi:hypothetical protein [Mycobacterium parmense]|uniref:Uncharacterized protein n=1 Tax=Mycobacterium parmense TaxID=185642 RepID=A0A7I7YXW9_9MYCO|nr:hypothetical protein [Mycobacterium parmense]MCV7350388.1 hypothetical protein [Mycobacterium parmense]ORW63371.1 hypothetical protein AWC20_04035 [Mycobacterium parmense]BBZ46192.1 hypothetical protein MPRM_34730 [Mycobacterium parmense]
MAVFVRRLFGIGKLPDELHAQVEAEGLLFLAEYVAVTRRFSGVIPGVRLPHSVASYTGSLVLTSERVLATLSMLPKLAGAVVNVNWDAPQTGAARVEISSTGLQVDVDVARVDPRFSGELSLHHKVAVPDDVLAGLPKRSLAFDMPPEYVFRAVGVTYSP